MKKITPDVVKVFVVPFVTIIVTVPLTFLVVGPVANYASDLILNAFTSIMNFSPIVYGLLLGALWQVIVMFGLHWALVPLAMLQFSQNGWTDIFLAAALPNFTQTGVLAAIMLKTKEQKVKTIAMPAFISSIFGVTEPAIYGVTLPMKVPFYISCIVSGFMGAAMMAFNVAAYSAGAMGVFVFPTLIGLDGNLTKLWIGVAIAVIGAIAAFAIQMVAPVPYLYGGPKDETPKTEEKPAQPVAELKELKQEIIASPISGKVVKLENVPDEVFAFRAMGKGIAVDPAEGVVAAPASGEITLVFPTGHAIGMRTENGAEILIHIGMDTVSLEGNGFNTLVKVGDKVQAGQKLLEFDLDTIRKANLPVISPIIVTNSSDYEDVLTTQETQMTTGDYLLTTLA